MAAPRWFAELIQKELQPWLTLFEDQIRNLWEHYEVLLRWNDRINLTSIPPGEEMVIRHYCESVFFGAHMPGASGEPSILDMGSGAGFPGVPIAILRPAWRITLLESHQRKAVFLRESTRGLPNISVLARRAESVPGRFDWVVSRGVDPKEVLRNVPRLARSVGLMLGEDDFSAIQSFQDIAWSKLVRLPWGDRRLCVYGEVSRGT
ncbi:MAG TPA: 16S rRNA (guanine(527)-N(7))-methyltransferase RsmG [Bryobacteraceae bacterium]|nr:16S rRNA (guanine(527)-N(7))-methyltransferase RsmG [Bryobacteraceae bacterium]